MKRLSSSDSLGGFMSICQTSTVEHSQENSHVYSREFQSMLEGFDEEGCVEESGYVPEKKRRLSGDQVKALEKNFEVENKLEPERKVKLAQELGLQPRQVAVWFQNRRARWKTKQLERDYGVLKANYDALKHSYDKLHLENNVLIQEIDELKSKLQDDKCEHNVSVKEVAQTNHLITENDDQEEEEAELNYENFNSKNGLNLMGVALFTNFKDRSSDSDSSAILNEDNSPIAASSGGGIFQDPNGLFNNSNRSSSLSMSGLQISDTKSVIIGDAHKVYDEPLFVKIEEHNFFSGDESCSTFFSDDQPPSLQWDCPEEWN